MEVKASAKFMKVSPRKARLVADLIRGRMVGEALNILSLTKKKSARLIEKVLKSAVSNASNNFKVKNTENLTVKTIFIDGGPVLKRHMPRARGTVNLIRKRTSHINLSIGE